MRQGCKYCGDRIDPTYAHRKSSKKGFCSPDCWLLDDVCKKVEHESAEARKFMKASILIILVIIIGLMWAKMSG